MPPVLGQCPAAGPARLPLGLCPAPGLAGPGGPALGLRAGIPLCLRPARGLPQSAWHEGLLPLPFCLARDPAGDAAILLTSASRALLLYTEDVRHCHQFDDLFAHMLARKLACLLAAPLLKSNSQKIAELEQLYSASLPQARQSDASERRPLPLPDSWLQAR